MTTEKIQGQSKTDEWLEKVKGVSMYADPPINSVNISDKLGKTLIMGTNAEIRALSELPLEKGNVRYCSKTYNFWASFFGTKDFIGEPEKRSLPAKIVSTGYIRHYDACGGSTEYVGDRLKEISEDWDVLLQFLERP
ncbi:hypothetical protein KAT80_02220 [Candidatus Pacearchaeota archaeon]|nr:hypothetical protein [Candidatus Pacearchaeota archaeon]